MLCGLAGGLLFGASARAQPEDVPIEPNAEPTVRVGGRVMTGFEVDRKHPTRTQKDAGISPGSDHTEPGFFLDQARLEVEAAMHERLRAVLSVDVDHGAVLRNAYVNWKPERELQLRAGHFKRPLSRLANESIGELPFRGRGLFDDLLLEQQNWGDRALGVMVHGKPLDGLRYFAAVMSPAAMGSGIEGADIIARIQYEPTPALALGLGAAHKWTERVTDQPNISLHAVSADVALSSCGFYAALEATAAQNPNPPTPPDSRSREPLAFGVIGYTGYYAELQTDLRLGPVAVFEWMDSDSEFGQDERVRGVLGVSLTFEGEHLRVMPQVELIRPLGNVGVRSEVAEENYYLLVSAGF